MIGGLTWSTLIGAAAVDSVNPCTLAVQIMLLSAILLAGKRYKVLTAGFGFTGAIFISYFFMGLGLYTTIQAASLVEGFFYLVIALAFLVGVLSIRAYFDYTPGVLAVEIPTSWRPYLKGLIGRVTSTRGAILIGFICSLFLLPCSSGPYLVILGLLAKTSTRMAAVPLLAIYNLVFVMPMIAITMMVYAGLTTVARAHRWRELYIRKLHLISGILMIGMSFLLTYALYVGWV